MLCARLMSWRCERIYKHLEGECRKLAQRSACTMYLAAREIQLELNIMRLSDGSLLDIARLVDFWGVDRGQIEKGILFESWVEIVSGFPS